MGPSPGVLVIHDGDGPQECSPVEGPQVFRNIRHLGEMESRASLQDFWAPMPGVILGCHNVLIFFFVRLSCLILW